MGAAVTSLVRIFGDRFNNSDLALKAINNGGCTIAETTALALTAPNINAHWESSNNNGAIVYLALADILRANRAVCFELVISNYSQSGTSVSSRSGGLCYWADSGNAYVLEYPYDTGNNLFRWVRWNSGSATNLGEIDTDWSSESKLRMYHNKHPTDDYVVDIDPTVTLAADEIAAFVDINGTGWQQIGSKEALAVSGLVNVGPGAWTGTAGSGTVTFTFGDFRVLQDLVLRPRNDGPGFLYDAHGNLDTDGVGRLVRDETGIVSRAIARLKIRRGQWIGDANMGSRLHQIETTAEFRRRAEDVIREALQPLIDEGSIQDVVVGEPEVDETRAYAAAQVWIVVDDEDIRPLGLISFGS